MNNINWKQVGAAIASTLTILAALPYQLGDLATIIPPSLKPTIVTLGLISTVALRVWNAAKPPPAPPPTPPPQLNPTFDQQSPPTTPL